MTLWSYTISTPALVAAIGIALATIVCSIRACRRSRGRRFIALEALRLIIVALLVFTLFKPERLTHTSYTEQPLHLVLYDMSESMATLDVADGNTFITRAEWLQAQLENEFWRPLSSDFNVQTVGFGDIAADSGDAVEGGMDAIGTDLNKALNDALTQYPDARAVILLSDGDWNLGRSPVQAAVACRRRGVPVYTVGVGSHRHLPDLILDEVRIPSYALLNEQIAVPFRVSSKLDRDVETAVRLTVEGRVLAERSIRVPAQGEVNDMLSWRADNLGRYYIDVRLPLESEEKILENNEAGGFIAIREETLKVLIVESEPRWEYRYLRNALTRDPGVDVDCLLMHPGMRRGDGHNYIRHFPGSREKLAQYDVIFLGDVGIGGNELTEKDATLIRGLIEQQASGLVFLPGSRGRIFTMIESPLAELLPVTLDPEQPQGLAAAHESRWEITTRGEAHLLTSLTRQSNKNRRVWQELPGFYWAAPVARSKPGAHVLAVHGSRRNEWGRLPLIVLRPFGNGQTLFMGTDSAWRWRRGVEDKYHYRFWGQVVRWMSHARHLAHDQDIRVFHTPETPQRGDTVFINANIFDDSGLPLSNDIVTATVTIDDDQQQLEFEAVEGGWGLYRTKWKPARSGTAEVVVSSRTTGNSLTSLLEITSVRREKIGQPARRSVLRDISRITGGSFVDSADVSQLLEAIRTAPLEHQVMERFKLWSTWWWGLIILGLCTTFWCLRKAAGVI
ncbi:MAG TPA: hypothetical protein DIT01_02495 [Lentisphaeria bacterium]|nr:hypothetical protein [Lentisphaeria bacterium]